MLRTCAESFVKECSRNPQIFEELVILKNIITKMLNLCHPKNLHTLKIRTYMVVTSIIQLIPHMWYYIHLQYNLYMCIMKISALIITKSSI